MLVQPRVPDQCHRQALGADDGEVGLRERAQLAALFAGTERRSFRAAASDAAASESAERAFWAPAASLEDGTLGRAFDHREILTEALEEVRRKLEYTAVATAFCGETFTLTELRTVYQVIWGQTLDPSNFRRKVLNTTGFVQPTGHHRLPPTGRPAALYHRGEAWLLSPPLLRATTSGR
ncbi:NrtR DNA-binding winged helix domain-containing protein [Streptomyces griseoflavus]|uniref:NrtR DNA-binding winged helix domain-containing protein n=1 Tax=Streptomyces griseoflavus TaxID=35619 RepID=UPI001995FA0B|nr:NUDIX hydrolase [Streptomyces griseoflavus]GGV43414.1 hypothetical protein GCM10010293_50000 [Streptomyces griseoflavus]